MSGLFYEVNSRSDVIKEPWRTTHYYHSDDLGLAPLMTSRQGFPVRQATYLPFGHEYNRVKREITRGYERDAESTLDYAMFRYHNSRIGRLMTPDPCNLITSACSGAAVSHRLFNSGQETPAEANRYAYVVNDPIDRTDPLGLQWECFPWDPWCWYPCPWWDPFCHERWPRRRPRGDDGESCVGWPGRVCWPGSGGPWGWLAGECRTETTRTKAPGLTLCDFLKPKYIFFEQWSCKAASPEATCLMSECRALERAYIHKCEDYGKDPEHKGALFVTRCTQYWMPSGGLLAGGGFFRVCHCCKKA